MQRTTIGIVLILLVLTVSVRAQNDVWINQTTPDAGPTLNAIQTINDHTAYAVGDTTTFAVFSDKDCSYHTRISPFPNLVKDSFTSLSFLNASTGVIVGNQALKTSNAGVTWDSLSIPPTASCLGVLMVSKDIIIIVGYRNLLIRSTDGGKTWKQHAFIEQDIGTLTSIKKIREDFIVIAGSMSYLMFSADSGKTWELQKAQFENQINGIAFDNDSDGVAVGYGGYIISTHNRGKDWLLHVWDTGYVAQTWLLGIEHIAPKHYVVAGAYNLLMYSTDGGDHWTQATKNAWATSIAFNGLSMLNDKFGYACGTYGFGVRTTDGGVTWKFLPKRPLTNELYSITYPKGDTLNGISVGETRTIMRTTDGD